MKKLTRSKLKAIKGSLSCAGCPIRNNYGPGSEYSNTCEQYFALSQNCQMCVDVSAYCFEN
ncbi:hypothetical protein SAMN05443633_103184 [Chryseobacterium arachidis]|uniref:Uncharacterized protein n=1 Tax=Chryseobacterium arachidis TaxID=1416778 RepID=A0A1M4ZK17_9FLAO|nr:hypothetical protein [Chryseobacterium arachidis]SHF18305.1 hypothetical protein SAMN05443633_103184 [Chryseobacterium arachidis]